MKTLIVILSVFGFFVENYCLLVQRDDSEVEICERISSRINFNLEDVMHSKISR